jgi:UTP--glucose-1-phosphate uridylyltransferase
MKAVIPAAGLGTRFLPATKTQPKEMLPVVDKPTIQYVVEELVASGIDDIIIITGRGKRALEDHFDRAYELEHVLSKLNLVKELDEIERLSELAEIHYIRQKEQHGLADAVHCARKHIGNEPFVVVLGDTIYVSKGKPVTRQCVEIFEKLNETVIAIEPVRREKLESYGIIKGKKLKPNLYRIEDMVEKPKPADAPSNLGITGTYVLRPEIFEYIEKTPPDRNGEVQLTDALRRMLKDMPIYGFVFNGKRYDIGTKLDWMYAFFELAIEHEKFGPELRKFIEKTLTEK